MRVDFPSSKSDKRRRNVIEAMEWSQGTVELAYLFSIEQSSLLCQCVEMSRGHCRYSTRDSSMQPHEDDDVVEIGSHFGANVDLCRKHR